MLISCVCTCLCPCFPSATLFLLCVWGGALVKRTCPQAALHDAREPSSEDPSAHGYNSRQRLELGAIAVSSTTCVCLPTSRGGTWSSGGRGAGSRGRGAPGSSVPLLPLTPPPRSPPKALHKEPGAAAAGYNPSPQAPTQAWPSLWGLQYCTAFGAEGHGGGMR